MTTQTIDQPCHVADMPDETYHADPVPGGSLSCSMAKVLIRPGGPAKLRHQLDSPRQDKRVFDLGHAAHLLVLGKGAPIRVIPDDLLGANGAVSTNAAKQFVADAHTEGCVPLKSTEARQVADMAERLSRTPEALAVLRAPGAQVELSAFTIDAQTGTWLRGRFDVVAPSVVADYKTAANAEPGKFARSTMLDLGYHMQAAHYLDLGAAVGLVDRGAPFRFVVQEKEAPYLVAVVTVGADYLALGRRDMRRAIDLWAACNRTNTWPGYPATVAEPPRWALDELNADLDPAIAAELEALLATKS